MIPTDCYGCKYFIRAHMGGSGPEGEYFPAECAIHARFIEDCKEQEYKD